MAHEHGRNPEPPSLLERDITRRSLLHALGLGTVTVTAGIAPAARHAAAQATPDATPPVAEAPKRAPGGPSLDQLLWDLEYDATKIFRFVADEVAYEAYAGVLRGVKGTHWSLAGNSADKALLLAELLTQAQVTVRLVAGTLDDDAAATLVAAMRIDAATARERAARVGAGDGQTLADRPDLTPEQRAVLASPQDLRARLLDSATAQLKDGVDVIQQALATQALSLPTPELALPDRERRQHVWVQYADGPRWVDLDPSFPEAEAGKAYATQTETWERVPDELHHRVRFRCIVESNVGGEATREDAFVHEARAADLVGVPVVFAHVDPNAVAKLGVSIGGILEGTTQYVPTLLAGEEGEIGTPVTLGGGGGGALDVLGDAGSGGSGPLGEWLEVAVLPPDAPEQVVTREVFDRVGIERRSRAASGAVGTPAETPSAAAATPASATPGAPAGVDLASLPPIELIDDPRLGKVFLPLEATWLLGVVGGRIPGTYFDQDYAIPDVEADMAVMAHGSFAARDGLQAEIAASYGYRWYHDQPNITAAILAPDTSDPSAIRLEASLDLVAQGYAVVPLAGTTGSVHPQVLAGVLAHVAER
ncbi:MAG: hypothetical protein ACTHQE_10500, partial [Thermomicrobiales bacterium]